MARYRFVPITAVWGYDSAAKAWGQLQQWERDNWKYVWLYRVFDDGSRPNAHFRRPLDFFTYINNEIGFPTAVDGWIHIYPEYNENPMMEYRYKPGYDGSIKRRLVKDIWMDRTEL
jgi:hypothetical protein